MGRAALKAVGRSRASLRFSKRIRKTHLLGVAPNPPRQWSFCWLVYWLFWWLYHHQKSHTVYEVTLALLPKQFIKIAFIIPQPLGFVILRLITINTFSWVQGGTGFPRVFLAFISRYTRFMLADVWNENSCAVWFTRCFSEQLCFNPFGLLQIPVSGEDGAEILRVEAINGFIALAECPAFGFESCLY